MNFSRFVGNWPHLLSYHLGLELIPCLHNTPAQTLPYSAVRDNTSHLELSSNESIIVTVLLPTKLGGVSVCINEDFMSVTEDIGKGDGLQTNIMKERSEQHLK